MYNAVLESFLVNGCESWKTKNDTSRINAVQITYMGRILCKTREDRVRNEKITQELQVPAVSKKIK